MAVNPDVGAQYGFTPDQWAAMTSAQRARYKSGATSSSQIAAQLANAGLTYQDAMSSGTAPAPAPAADYYGGSYTGGGGGAVISRPPYDVNADPSYQAFVAALDQMGETYRSQAAQKQAEYDRQLQDLLPRIAEQGVEQRKNISGAAESRGMFRSGERLRDIGLQQRGETQRVTDAQQATARSKTAVDQNLQQQIADLARQRAERAFTMTSAQAY
jgi:hypothetical protein